MSYVIAAPGMLAATAADVAGIGSSLSEANGAAAPATTRVIAAGSDEVSAAIASLFSSHGKAFQALSAQAAAFHSRFVQALIGGAGAYAGAEAANAAPFETLTLNLTLHLPVPNAAVSVGGFTLLRAGSATASSNFGGLAVAFGANSNAMVTGGIFNTALAIGNTSLAQAGTGNLNLATAFGANSASYAGLAGNLDTAVALGKNSIASAASGNFNFASALGTGSAAVAGGVRFVPGSGNVALVLGTGSTAFAGASPTTSGGNGDLAVAVGNMLEVAATGTHQLVTSVF
jgi:PE family